MNDDWGDFIDNGDGSVTFSDGTITDYMGVPLGYDNGDGSWTDLSGNIFDNSNNLIGTDNGDGTWTDLSGTIFTDSGEPIAQQNQDGTILDAAGNLIYPNGDKELADGTWIFSDGSTFDPLTLGASDRSTDSLLRSVGAPTVGGSLGGSTSGSGSASSNSALNAAIQALAQLAKSATSTQQQAAIRAAQNRLGATPTAGSMSDTTKILLAAAAGFALFAFARSR